MAEATMREVLQRIRAENCRAMLELRAFHYALEHVVKNIEQIATAADEIHLALKNTGALVNERAERLSIHATQTVLALRAVRVAALSWTVAGQSALHPTAMRGVVKRLRAERGDAMVELRAFDASSDHLLRILGLLAVARGCCGRRPNRRAERRPAGHH